MCECFSCIYVYVPHACMVSSEARREGTFPTIGVVDGCELSVTSCLCQNYYPGLLEEQPMLITEPSFQLLLSYNDAISGTWENWTQVWTEASWNITQSDAQSSSNDEQVICPLVAITKEGVKLLMGNLMWVTWRLIPKLTLKRLWRGMWMSECQNGRWMRQCYGS